MAHLIPKQRIKRAFPFGAAVMPDGSRVRCDREDRCPAVAVRALSLIAVVWDPRVVVPICGGPMGSGGHHGQLDYAGVNRLRVPRAVLPGQLEEYAVEYGLEWSLEADYGLKER
jgi:hypothetical protein